MMGFPSNKSESPFQFLKSAILLFTPKNLHLLKFFVLLHQLEKSEL